MRAVAVLFVIFATLGCGSTQIDTPTTPAGPSSGDEREAAIYSAVIRQLVKRDNTFGSAPTSFKVIYVLDGPIERAADPEAQVTGGDSVDAFSETLKATGGNREEAAEMLGIGERTLYRKIKEYGLN